VILEYYLITKKIKTYGFNIVKKLRDLPATWASGMEFPSPP